VTRDQLRDVLEEDEGWDVIHISGHGAPGELLLETEAGLPDRVTAAELAGVLDLARERVKLVSLSACWSAALTAAEHRRLLGLSIPAATPAEGNGVAGRDGGTDQGDQFTSGALATELAGQLGCAVLAMRYPVTDDFAIALAAKLYDLLARQGRPLPRELLYDVFPLVSVGNDRDSNAGPTA
jgi:CHAT domain